MQIYVTKNTGHCKWIFKKADGAVGICRHFPTCDQGKLLKENGWFRTSKNQQTEDR
jgi:hypothetical protein